MELREYFLAACKGDAPKELGWMFSFFAQTEEEPDAWMTNPYPYRLVKTAGEPVRFVNPANTAELLVIEGTEGTGPLVPPLKQIDLKPGDLANVITPITTTYNNVVANCLLIIYAMNDKIPFITGRMSAKQIEKIILPRLETPPKDPKDRNDKDIYTDELYQFTLAADFLMRMTQLAIPGDTEKSVTTHPDMAKLRDELYEKHKHELSNPLVVADIERQLKELDKDVWLKDDPSLGLWVKDEKDFGVVRRKLFYHVGHESGFNVKATQADPIKNSLDEGWDVNNFDKYNNSTRSGTYGRGVQTAFGGELYNWLSRISVNISVLDEDCGSMLGDRITITKDNYKTFGGYYYLGKQGQPIRYDINKAEQYLGHRMIFRSPQYCKSGRTDYCKYCIGDELALHPEGVSLAISNVGSRIMGMFMATMHGKALTTAEFDLFEELT